MKKTFLRILLILFILGVAGACYAVHYYNKGIAAVSSEPEEVIVTIENGQSAYSILDTLYQHGLVKDLTCGKIYLKLNAPNHLQANTYILNKDMSLQQMFTIMEDPAEEYLLQTKVTILDGSTIPDIAASIASSLQITSSEVEDLLNNDAFLQTLIDDYWFLTDEILQDGIKYPLEGYLYPETYQFRTNCTLEDVIRTSLDMMDTYLTSVKADIEALDWTPHEFLTFASIVERESLFDADRPKIAGVFFNRLEINMRLQSDITVNYAWDRTGVDVSYSHLEIDSPYNTYKYSGLPIGPISTVSSVTMDSCIHYEEHSYLYFFAKKDGTVIYSSTLAEHNKAVSENKWY